MEQISLRTHQGGVIMGKYHKQVIMEGVWWKRYGDVMHKASWERYHGGEISWTSYHGRGFLEKIPRDVSLGRQHGQGVMGEVSWERYHVRGIM